MNRRKLHNLHGLKWNPFTPDIPTEGLWTSPQVDNFCHRVENMVDDGGFALIAGEPGNGKSVTLRLLAERFNSLPEIQVGVLSRPQSGLADFYRELGDIFGVNLRPHNRWGGFKALRERWKAHAESHLLCPILLIDEAQEMNSFVLSELRLLCSGNLDSELYLTVILAGDGRLLDRLRQPDLLPLESRIRTRLLLEHTGPTELLKALDHVLEQAGNRSLIEDSLKQTLVERAAGNFRVLMNVAGELLLLATQKELSTIDERLFFSLYEERNATLPKPRGRKRRNAGEGP